MSIQNNTCITAELGDYDPALHTEGFISEFRFVPNQVNIWFSWAAAEVLSRLCKTTKMVSFRKVVIGFQSSTGFAKQSILYVWKGSKYACIVITSTAQKMKFSITDFFSKCGQIWKTSFFAQWNEFEAYLMSRVHVSMIFVGYAYHQVWILMFILLGPS